MIKAKREKPHLANRDVVFAVRRGEDDCAFFYLTDTQNRHLGLIDDGSAEQAAKDAGVGDGKCTAGYFIRL